MSEPEKKDPEIIEKVTLSKVECLELQNLNLQRQLLETQVRQQASMLEKKEQDLTAMINGVYGIEIQKYRVNAETGDCVYDPQGATQAQAQRGQLQPQ